ncbi:MAG: hypothetical protein R3F60_04830 [bacterium]
MAELFQDEHLPPRQRPWRVPPGTTLPPPPPGTRHVRVPGLGLVIADDDLRRRLEHLFHWPMILLALAVLPLLAIELWAPPTGSMEVAVDVGFGVIWFAFLIEFIAKVALAESRLEYVRRNWLDLVIIIVPVLRALRLTSLVRMVRLFKLRGVAFKFARSAMTLFVTFQVADRVLRRFGFDRPVRPREPPPETMTRYALQDEVRRLRRRREAWETWYVRHRLFLEERGVLTYELPADESSEEE